jgi:hypothetical protein
MEQGFPRKPLAGDEVSVAGKIVGRYRALRVFVHRLTWCSSVHGASQDGRRLRATRPPICKGVANFCKASSFRLREGDGVKNYIINFRPFWDRSEASQKEPDRPFQLSAGTYNATSIVLFCTESSFAMYNWCVLMLIYQFRSLIWFISSSTSFLMFSVLVYGLSFQSPSSKFNYSIAS